MRSLIAVFMLAVTPLAAYADDPLSRFAPLLAANPTGLVFHHTAPLEGFVPDAPTLQGPSDEGLRKALLGETGLDPVSGLDWDAVTGTLTIGAPPNDLLVILGTEGFAGGVEAALLARDFERHDITGLPVLAKGDDNRVDVANARQPDPFAGGMGKAQRVALGDGFIAVGRNWPSINAALESLNNIDGAAAVWRATLDALARSRGDNHLDAAWGWGADSFAGMLIDPGKLIDGDIDAAIAAIEGGPQLLFPPFPLAIFALDRADNATHLRIALPYSTVESATAAADYVAKGLALFPNAPAPPDVKLIEAGTQTVAVMTLGYPAGETSAANALMWNWVGAVMQRNFVPLQFGRF